MIGRETLEGVAEGENSGSSDSETAYPQKEGGEPIAELK